MSATTPFDCSPELSLQTIQSFDGLILVDLDETLYLRNSTEDFLDSAAPGLLVLSLLKLLDLLKPWRLTGGHPTRDVWRVQAVRILLPWTMLAWRRRVAQLATQFANSALVTALKTRSTPPIISTVGFKPIVLPLIAALGFGSSRVIAARANFTDRRKGKLRLVSEELSSDAIGTALVVTDSPDDVPLLAACGKPLRTVWPAAHYRTALHGIYLPGRYLSKIKRPNERYIWRGIVQEDFALWILSTAQIAHAPLSLVGGLSLLLISFWAIYERGYVDNDKIAEQFESDPKLSAAYSDHTVATPTIQPWVWAALFGAGGLLVLHYPNDVPPVDFLKWGMVLIATELLFKFYNRMDKATRVWIYSLLQLARAACFVIVVPITPIGYSTLGAHALSRWAPYYAYRISGTKDLWRAAHPQLIRLMFLTILTALLVVADGFYIVFNIPAALIFLWTLYRARRELRSVLKAAHRIDTAATRSQ